MAMVGIKIEQSTICGLIATDQSFHTRFYYNLLYWVKHTDYYTYSKDKVPRARWSTPYTGRLLPNGVPFSGFRYMKGLGFL